MFRSENDRPFFMFCVPSDNLRNVKIKKFMKIVAVID